MGLTLQQLAGSLDLEFRGDADLKIEGVASLGLAGASDLTFVQHKKYLAELASSECAAVILPVELAGQVGDKALLISTNPHFSFVRAIETLGVPGSSDLPKSIHPSAQIAESAVLGENLSIGAMVVIGENVRIGSGTSIGAGSVIDNDVMIGDTCLLHSRVTLNHSVQLGSRCELHSGVVIGSDGFGLVQQDEQWHKIPHLGSVIIEDDVEIGANTTVDRGALDDTIIETGCKLDNQIQVAHNVRIGAHTAIAACVGIAGSASIGRYCKISGAAVVLGHLSVADHVTVTAMSLVTKDIKQSGVFSSGTPLLENRLWHRVNARYKTLDELAQIVARLEKQHD